MPAAPGLVQALAVDTKRRTQDLDFLSLVPWRFLRWLVVGLAFLVLLYLIGLGSGRELRTAALRLLLIPVHYTQLEVEPGHHTLKAGQDLTVRVLLKGRPVAAVEIQYRPRDGGEEWTRLPLEPPVADAPGSPDTREATVKDCQQDLEYRVLAGPLTSKTYQVTVLRPLVLEAIEAAIEPPAYTRRPATMVKEGNFKVIEGSRVRFRIRLDRPVQTAQLLFATVGRSPKPRENLPPLELSMEGQDLLGELAEVRKEVEYEIFAEAADGMRLEADRFRIQVQLDRKPAIRFVKPEKRIEVTPSTEVRMRVEATDDFGLARAGIVYQIGNGPKKTLLLHEDPAQPTSVTLAATLALEEHQVSFRDGVTYYAFAEDNYPGRPHRTVTELQFIDIRPYKRSYQLLESGGS